MAGQMDGKVAPRELGEAALRDLVDAAFDALVITHAGKVVFANRSFVEMYGGSAEEVIGTSMLEFVAPECRETVIARMAQSDARYEAIGLRRDGTRIDVEICARNGTYDGKPVRISAIRYITERKLAEAALRRSEARLRGLIERIEDIIVVERDGAIVFANPAALRYLGYADLAAIAGVTVLELLHAGDRAAWRARPSDALVTARLLRRDGTIGTVEIASAAMDEFDGAPASVVLARDVGARHLMEARLVEADRLSSIGMLAAGIAHEINNPLAYVTLNLGVMARKLAALRDDPGRLTETCRELEELLAITQQGADRVQQIVRDVRIFARGGSDVRSAVALPQILDSTIQLAASSIGDRVRLVRDYQPVPLVLADAPRLGQLFLNLLVNALQAFDDATAGEIRVRTGTAADGSASVEIADTGCGIAADALGRVFEPFFTTKPAAQGTGLGLSICRSIVTALGGTIEIASRVGEGTTCRVALPAAKAAPAPVAAPVAVRATRRRILIVDDEETLLRTLQDELGQHHDVACAASGDDAIRLLRTTTFDVVLCDVMMPSTSGIDVFQALRQHRPGDERRIVFMTGGAFTGAARDFLASVPNPKLEKPFSYDELVRAIDQVE